MNTWRECYPPDFDHGGHPLLGDDPTAWHDSLEGMSFVGAQCTRDGRIVIVIATIDGGFVDVHGTCVREGEALTEQIADALREAEIKIPVDKDASRLLGLDVEITEDPPDDDWITAARRIEIDLLSTIHRLARE